MTMFRRRLPTFRNWVFVFHATFQCLHIFPRGETFVWHDVLHFRICKWSTLIYPEWTRCPSSGSRPSGPCAPWSGTRVTAPTTCSTGKLEKNSFINPIIYLWLNERGRHYHTKWYSDMSSKSQFDPTMVDLHPFFEVWHLGHFSCSSWYRAMKVILKLSF